jgi:hypothetical protein
MAAIPEGTTGSYQDGELWGSDAIFLHVRGNLAIVSPCNDECQFNALPFLLVCLLTWEEGMRLILSKRPRHLCSA